MTTDEPLDAGLGERLKKLRKIEGLNQAELARRAKLSPAYLSELEGGHGRRPSGDVLLRLANAFDATVAELLGRDIGPADDVSSPTPSLEQFASERGIDPSEIRMLASIRFRGDPPNTSRRWAMIYDAIIASRAFDER